MADGRHFENSFFFSNSLYFSRDSFYFDKFGAQMPIVIPRMVTLTKIKMFQFQVGGKMFLAIYHFVLLIIRSNVTESLEHRSRDEKKENLIS